MESSESGALEESPTEAYVANDSSSDQAVGRYRLIERIGEGGMGTVWMAEQREPVKRMVALKLIKRGVDSKSVLARFDAERQALALMDHPNIAKIFDGGISDSGSPYFVMELVKGVPITEFCDSKQLTLAERLRLFIPVCQAIQHAHEEKGTGVKFKSTPVPFSFSTPVPFSFSVETTLPR